MLEKDLKECAQATDLEGYKETRMKINRIEDQIMELQDKSREFPEKKYSFNQYLEEIRSIICESGLRQMSDLISRINAK